MKCGEFELTHTTNILTNYCNNLYQESDTFSFFLLLLLLFLDLLSNLLHAIIFCAQLHRYVILHMFRVDKFKISQINQRKEHQ